MGNFLAMVALPPLNLSLVRLAAVRARVWRELVAVDEQQLRDSAVFSHATLQHLWADAAENRQLATSPTYTALLNCYREVRRWRKRLPPGTGSNEILLAALRAAHTDFLTSASLVPLSEQTTLPVCGWWTVKDLFGHLADWDILFLNGLKGEETAVRGIPLLADEDAFNAALQTSRAAQSLVEVTADFAHIRHTFLTSVASLSQEDLKRPSTDPARYPTLYQDVWATIEHYLEHTAGMRRQLNIPVPTWLLTC